MPDPAIVAVLGPTASGKSALALALAERFDGEIINCDSTAVYRGFDIGTDKVPVAERRGIAHHLIDIADPTEVYTAAQFANDAARAIRAIHARGRVPILVGGSGLYYRALTRGLFPGPAGDERLRARLDAVASRRGSAFLHRMLRRVDPPSADRILPGDRKRMIRALEVFFLTGRPLTSHFADTVSPIAGMRVIAFALRIPAALTAERVARRVDQQFARGLLAEVRGLLTRGVPESARPFGGLVYRQALEHLHGVRDEAATRELIARENRHYARRQSIWFRKEPDLEWFDGPGESAATIAAVEQRLEQRLGEAVSHTVSRQSIGESGVSRPFKRVIVIVMDSAGIGELPDAAAYGDEGSDTLGNIARQVPLAVPTLRSLGLGRIANIGVGADEGTRAGAYGRMAEASAGKDSVTGHWEMMGIVLDRPFPVFPNGFSPDIIAEFSRLTGRGVIGNIAASGTRIIDDCGPEHLRTGAWIVYTSADSVFQIAAHEEVVPIPELYRACEIAYRLVGEGLGVGRVIARPFVGQPGAFRRTANRHDYALPPSAETLLDRATAAGVPVVAIGKIQDLFAARGIGRALHTSSDEDGMTKVVAELALTPSGFIFANLVDFDTQYGHRNDVRGYAENLERFDTRLADLLPRLAPDDLLIVTADHGNDPTTPSTDHAREYVPLLATGSRVARDVDLGTRATFADLGQTLAENFALGALAHGTSFLHEIIGG
ncbi:MAG TPA: phosphopentomutase [Vicinamibacterales bacterium]|nr:phosphopentomutase [Vicinamibacterales bacterium]